MPNEPILKYDPGEKSLKAPFVIYIDLECTLKKVLSCQNNPEKSYTGKKAIHETSGWTMAKICSFDKKENKLYHYREKDCIENLCKKLKKEALELINYKKRDIIPLTQEENNRYNEQEICYKCGEKFCMDKDDKDYINKKKVKDHCQYTGKFREATYSICNLKYNVPKEIPIIIHNATYDTYFMLNQLAIEFNGELNCIGDNTEKYISFSVPIKKEVIDNNGNKKAIIYKLKFIDSYRFMPISLSEFVDCPSEIFNSIEYELCIERINIKSECHYVGLKNDKLIHKCKKCKEECERPIIDELKEKFSSIYQFCDGDLNKFVLVLRKGVYPYEYMDSWEKFNETTLPPKDAFYSNLNLEDITVMDYTHTQKGMGCI